MKSYTAYKPSGIPWLGDVPEHWDKLPGKVIISERNKKNIGMVETRVLSLSYGNIIIKPMEKLKGLVPESFETYQIVEPGNIIIRSTDLQNDHISLRVGLVKDKGIITSAYLCFEVQNQVFPDYLYLLLHSLDLLKIIYAFGSGLRQNLSYQDFKNLRFDVPPLLEQIQISRFLDWKVGQINKFIKAKKRIIELLKEQKQAIINDAVTGKIDVHTGKPYPKYKPSGVEWLGDIPEGWEVRRLRNILTPISLKNRSDLPLLSVVREKGIILRNSMTDEENHNFIPDDLSGYKVVEKGQFAMNKMKAWQGSYGISQYNGIVSPAYFVFDVNFQNSDFFHIAIRSKNYIKFFAQASDGIRIGQWDLSLQRMKEIPFIVPPLETQEIISNYIPNILQTIEKSINNNIKEILLVQEYKDRIIADVVTGKVDVRDIEVPVVIEDVEEEIIEEENEEIEEMEGEE